MNTSQKIASIKKDEKEVPLIMKTEKLGGKPGDFDGPLPYFDGEEDDDQQLWDDELCQNIQFSDEENEEDDNGMGFKSSAYYMFPPQIITEKKGRISNKVDETKYQKAIEKLGPNYPKQADLMKKYGMLKDRHQEMKEAQKNKFSMDD